MRINTLLDILGMFASLFMVIGVLEWIKTGMEVYRNEQKKLLAMYQELNAHYSAILEIYENAKSRTEREKSNSRSASISSDGGRTE